MIAILLHGDAPFGWRGFAFAALVAFALWFLFNQLAKTSLKKLKRNRGGHRKAAGKTHLI